MEYIQPVEGIAAESAGLDFLDEVPVGARDDADVDLDGLGAADCPALLLLDHAQQLHLQVYGHLADLVQKNRPVVGGGEQAWATLHGAREGAFHVPEELAFEKRLRDGSTVDGNERLSAPGTGRVDGAGNELLAGAALAGHEHVARGRSG